MEDLMTCYDFHVTVNQASGYQGKCYIVFSKGSSRELVILVDHGCRSLPQPIDPSPKALPVNTVQGKILRSYSSFFSGHFFGTENSV